MQKALYQEKLSKEELLGVDKNIHTTVLGERRIKRNLKLENIDVIEFCKSIIQNGKCDIYRQGKNYYFIVPFETVSSMALINVRQACRLTNR